VGISAFAIVLELELEFMLLVVFVLDSGGVRWVREHCRGGGRIGFQPIYDRDLCLLNCRMAAARAVHQA
jgi:hypothetical protein